MVGYFKLNRIYQKTIDFMYGNNFPPINKNPLQNIINNTKYCMKETNGTYKKIKSGIYSMNHNLPRIHSLSKLHKKNVPIGLIITVLNSPTHKLGKIMLDLLDAFYYSPFYRDNSETCSWYPVLKPKSYTRYRNRSY